MSAPAVAILPILILLLIVGGLIVGIILWITGGKGGAKGEMSCGGCGYAVRGLEALNCPECGADLRMVGINRGQGGGKRGIGIALTLFCSFLLLGCLGSTLFMVGSNSSSTQPSTIQLQQSMPSTTNMIQITPAQPVPVDLAEPEDGEDQVPATDPQPVEAEPTP